MNTTLPAAKIAITIPPEFVDRVYEKLAEEHAAEVRRAQERKFLIAGNRLQVILEHGQPWPQRYFRRLHSSGVGYEEGYEDEDPVHVVEEARAEWLHARPKPPTKLVTGPIAERVIHDYLVRNSYWTQSVDFNAPRQFCGLEWIFDHTVGMELRR